MLENIVIKGARENNLKNVDLVIPKNKFVVITGLSGSGKSSLAFDTIFAEGQRRYIESLSSYARMFLGQMDKPDVDYIDGLSPAISIDQKTTSKNPRSTVGTVTEIYDYLRLLWARIGIPHCPKCGKEISARTVDQIVDAILKLPEHTKIQVLSPVIRGRKGEHKKVFDDARKSGYTRVRADGIVYQLTEEIPLEKTKKHSIEIVVDRLVIKPDINRRLTDSVETAVSLSGGIVMIEDITSGEVTSYSQNYACEDCDISLEELSPRMFSFNNPSGACPECSGLGTKKLIDPDRIIPNKRLSLSDGAICASGWSNIKGDSISRMYFEALAEKYSFSLNDSFDMLSSDAVNAILYGTGKDTLDLRYERKDGFGTMKRSFEGIIPNLERRYRETQSEAMRDDIEECMSEVMCPCCKGKRLNAAASAVTVGNLTLPEFVDFSVTDAISFTEKLQLSDNEKIIASQITREILARLNFMNSVGLGYLTLSRSAGTLSGGESQRIRLATQIGSGLTGVLYILDEPSIGLHQRDNGKLIESLKNLQNLGNSLIIVEHDTDTMKAADFIVDVGPRAGEHGGKIVCAGTLDDVMACKESVTGKYLTGELKIAVPESRRKGNGKTIDIIGATEHNLKNINVSFPVGVLTCVTGVSGSGKSSLVNEILYKVLAAEKNRTKVRAGKYREIHGLEAVDKVIAIDQSPIGRTPRSNPATYTGVFNDIRELFASTQDAKMRGYDQGRFSFNVKGGRCEACTGDGLVKVEMHFLSDVFVPCEVCRGKRYNRETLEIKYKDKNISEVLDMTVDEAMVFFANQPRIIKKIETLHDVGLGYIRLGQPSTTLSGGEAQRIKLASELSKRSTGSTVYILDEPTTGLHSADIECLVNILNRLTDAGNTIVVIEHNLDVIKVADYIIDLGPEGGDGGGTLVFAGTPEECAECAESYTGQYLKPYLCD